MNHCLDRFLHRIATLAALLTVLSGPVIAQDISDVRAAATRIETLLNEVSAARQDLAARVDYEAAPATMAAGMHQNGANLDAIENYARDWGQGYLYTAWADIQPFYDAHTEALAISLQRIREATTVTAADTEYLERGMDAWREVEFELTSMFDQLTESLSDRGLYLGRSLELNEQQHAETECCGPKWEEFNVKIAEEQEQADEFSQRSVDLRETLRGYGSRRLFSAIDAVTRIAVAETEGPEVAETETGPMECEEEWYYPEDIDVLDDIQAAYDESESNSAAFLEQSGQASTDLWTAPDFLKESTE